MRSDVRTFQARGSVLILAIGIMIVLTGLVLVFSRQMRVETMASGNLLTSVQADAIVTGAATYVANCLVNNTDQTQLDTEILSEAVPLGDGMFWLIRPNPQDETQYSFGVADEAGKLNINASFVTADVLLGLPGMTPDLAASIVDWRSTDTNDPGSGGAESDYYTQLPEPYYCKNSAFETLDELFLVKGATLDVLFGVDTNRNGVVDEDEAGQQGPLTNFSGLGQCGVCKYLTVYSQNPLPPTPAKKGSTPTPAPIGLINVNTAPREVLLCLPGLTSAQVDELIAVRTANGADLTTLSWIDQVLPASVSRSVKTMLTVTSYQFSADIVGVTGNGRGFKRVKYVFDLRNPVTPLPILYRQDLTHLGWPLSREILEALRQGKPVPVSSGNSFSLGRR